MATHASPSRMAGALWGRTNLARRLARDTPVALSTAFLGALVLLALFGPFLLQSPTDLDIGTTLEPPSLDHPMGTDQVGRDVLARFTSGARISLVVATLVVLVGASVGGIIGLLAGALGRGVDGPLMRAMDAVLAFPPLILAMAVTVGLGVGLETAALGIMITSIPWYARLLRSEVIRIRTLPFVEAAVALGASKNRVMARHIVPHLAPTLFIQGAAVFGYAILSLAALGFVGLGAQIPTPEWGTMITEGGQYVLTGQWWIGVFPGVGLLIATTTTSIIADRARDLLDPSRQYSQI